MNTDFQEAIIALSGAEAAAFLGTAEATEEMLTSIDHTYRSVKEKVEHIAAELNYQTERTVLIFDEGDEPIARYDALDGLVIDETVAPKTA